MKNKKLKIIKRNIKKNIIKNMSNEQKQKLKDYRKEKQQHDNYSIKV